MAKVVSGGVCDEYLVPPAPSSLAGRTSLWFESRNNTIGCVDEELGRD